MLHDGQSPLSIIKINYRERKEFIVEGHLSTIGYSPYHSVLYRSRESKNAP